MLQLPRQSKVPKPTAAKVYVALSSFATLMDGLPHVVQMGSRLRGDHALVQRMPERFVEDGMSDLDVARTAAARRRPPEPVPQKPPKPVIPVDRRWIVKEDFFWGGDRYIRGQAYDVDSAPVRAAPDFFFSAVPKE